MIGSYGLPHCFGDANSLCICCVTKEQFELKQGRQAERFSLWCGSEAIKDVMLRVEQSKMCLRIGQFFSELFTYESMKRWIKKEVLKDSIQIANTLKLHTLKLNYFPVNFKKSSGDNLMSRNIFLKSPRLMVFPLWIGIVVFLPSGWINLK